MQSDSVKSSNLYAVVMAGGAGSRLWPESRAKTPKPFLKLGEDGKSLLRATFDRLDGLVPLENRFVVAGRNFAQLVRESLPELGESRLLLEPIGRDTAPCVLWSALEIARLDPDATTIVLPSDHAIAPADAFRNALDVAARLVENRPERVVTLGIPPTEPSSAFGYVERDARLDEIPEELGVAYRAVRFHEKPDRETAIEYLASKRYYWNAGVFVWKARRILDLVKRLEPALGATLDELQALDPPQNRLLDACPRFDAIFSRAKRVSIDRAVLDKLTDDLVVVDSERFQWNDLGTYAALERLAAPDANGNAVVGARLVALNSSGVFARVAAPRLPSPRLPSPRQKLVALVGVQDLLVVDAGDALLVAKKGNDDALRELVEKLRDGSLDDYL